MYICVYIGMMYVCVYVYKNHSATAQATGTSTVRVAGVEGRPCLIVLVLVLVRAGGGICTCGVRRACGGVLAFALPWVHIP